MIHRNDERVFRVVEVTCYIAMFLSPAAAQIASARGHSYFSPIIFFVGLGAGALMFLTRFFIYAHPENLRDRTRAESISLSQKTKRLLVVGYAMCAPMFVLGCVGLLSPRVFEQAVAAISPMRFIASDTSALSAVGLTLLLLAAGVIFIGLTRSLPLLVRLGGMILFGAMICLFFELRWG